MNRFGLLFALLILNWFGNKDFYKDLHSVIYDHLIYV